MISSVGLGMSTGFLEPAAGSSLKSYELYRVSAPLLSSSEPLLASRFVPFFLFLFLLTALVEYPHGKKVVVENQMAVL